ncbi:MAG: acyl-CoA dehydrogenase family protein [Deltaproteobacteria bacterium]|nr:acyl-CoA dehydrogenase family protein [Deltaproteobacteria bacterium]
MERTIFSEEHDIFRRNFRQFVETRVIPQQSKWRKQGVVDRELWLEAGKAGFLCPWLDEEYGGPGGDFLHSVVVIEELARAYESGWAASLHSDIIVPYIETFGTPEQKKQWLPKCASGEVITALAMTEPGTGSDVAAIATTAKRDGDEYVLNGAKTFISNGMSCDLVVVAARTENSEDPHRSVSLLLVEGDRPGFIRGRKLEKMGLESQDTTELAFDDCRIPVANLLGQEGGGFVMLMQKLQQERLTVGAMSQAGAEKVLEDTIAYTQEREAFGRPISKFQNTQFKLAECATEIEIGRAFLDKLLVEHIAGKYLVKECSMAKYWLSEMQGRVVDTCLQLYGGYGYMLEYPISRAFVDARVQRIYAGTNEIMKVIIAKQMGL